MEGWSILWGGYFSFRIAFGIEESSIINEFTVLFKSVASRRSFGKNFMVSPTPFWLNSFSASSRLYFQINWLSFLKDSNAAWIFWSYYSSTIFFWFSFSFSTASLPRSGESFRNLENFSFIAFSDCSKSYSSWLILIFKSVDSSLAYMRAIYNEAP